MKLRLLSPWAQDRKILTKQIVSRAWHDRDDILRSDVNLFCWRRPSDSTMFAYLRGLSTSQPGPIEIGVSKDELANQIREVRTDWDRQAEATSESFWQDVISLTRDFLSFSSSGTGTLHLKVIDDNACSKFHTDGYALRLFTTYYGKGTEWLPESAVNRQYLGTTNDRIIKNVDQIQRMDAFEVGILKGEPSSNRHHKNGIVHRSPAIEREANSKRVILRIDLD